MIAARRRTGATARGVFWKLKSVVHGPWWFETHPLRTGAIPTGDLKTEPAGGWPTATPPFQAGVLVRLRRCVLVPNRVGNQAAQAPYRSISWNVRGAAALAVAALTTGPRSRPTDFFGPDQDLRHRTPSGPEADGYNRLPHHQGNPCENKRPVASDSRNLRVRVS